MAQVVHGILGKSPSGQTGWRVPRPVPPTDHGDKYRAVYTVDGVRVVGFDNERGKGDHCHLRLTERRWALVTALPGQGAMAVRELARRSGRDVKRVHEVVQVLAELGLVERDAAGGVPCPFADVRIDMRLHPESIAA